MTAAPPETEAQFLTWVLATAEALGWLRHHQRPAMKQSGQYVSAIQGDSGFLDLVLVRPPRVIIAELKSNRGRLRPEQQVWAGALLQCPGVEFYLWKPRDRERIEATLRRKWR